VTSGSGADVSLRSSRWSEMVALTCRKNSADTFECGRPCASFVTTGEVDMPIEELSQDDPRAYIRLALLVRRRISTGDLVTGFPVSITMLSQEFGHARQTCSKALQLLVDEEVLFRVPGLGYYVTKGARQKLRQG
jgi:hypothetical protein